MEETKISSPFKVDFDIYSYTDILPKLGDYLKEDFVINQDHHEKGRIEKMIWKKYHPTIAETESREYRQQELRRILRTGVWAWIKDYPIWLPPNYYYALQYGCAGEDELQFRIKRLKHVYFKIRARNNPACKGTFTVKNRQDGETTMAMTDSLWECCDGIMNVGQIGLQSKTRNDAFNPCWMTIQTLWHGIPKWLKDEVYSDFSSGDSIAEKFRFERAADEMRGIQKRNIIVAYYPAVYNAMDGKNNMKKCILDEVLKWVECNFGDSLENYSKFIMPGFERRGLFDIFSSPPEQDCKSYREGYAIWQDSNTDEMDPVTGTTKSRLHRWYSNPLDGIQGAYDEYGDADAQQIYDHIMRERASKPKDKYLEEVRGFPLNEEEMWGSLDAASVWSNSEGLKQRKTFLIGHKFKDKKETEPARLYGNLEWRDGVIDTDVDFRIADKEHFDLDVARFCFSYVPDPRNKQPLEYDNVSLESGGDVIRPIPPEYVENSIGVDPFNHRYMPKDNRASDHAMVCRQFRDIFKQLPNGVLNIPTGIYCCRPSHQDIAFEDTIKFAVFTRGMINYESRSDKFANYAEDRGYFDWLLPEIGQPRDSKRKGDAPSGRGKFLAEGMGLLDANINTPLRADQVYRLLYFWFPEQIIDYLGFNPKNTQKANLTMADMQALIGVVKLMNFKIRQPSELNNAVLDYILG